MPRAFDPSLPQVEQMAPGLHFAGAAQIVAIDHKVPERRFASYDSVTIEQGLVLHRERVERPAEL